MYEPAMEVKKLWKTLIEKEPVIMLFVLKLCAYDKIEREACNECFRAPRAVVDNHFISLEKRALSSHHVQKIIPSNCTD